MRNVARPYIDRTRDRQQSRDIYFCQQAVFALMRAGVDRRDIRFQYALRDLAEAQWGVRRRR